MFDMVLNTRIWFPSTTQAQVTITLHIQPLYFCLEIRHITKITFFQNGKNLGGKHCVKALKGLFQKAIFLKLKLRKDILQSNIRLEKVRKGTVFFFIALGRNEISGLTHFMPLSHSIYPLKTSENQRFFYVFRVYRMGQWHEIG